jgi:copper oxidase (laccase) domain-containing protein
VSLAGTPVQARWTNAGDGDHQSIGRSIGDGPVLATLPSGLSVRRLRQVHGGDVVVVDTPVPAGVRAWGPDARDLPPEGDALVASGGGFALAVLTADCASVALGSPEGISGAVHVGWRGLGAQVLERAVDTMGVLGATAVVAGVGPCIGPCCYEFSEGDLDRLVARCGPEVRGHTTWGHPSLDLPAAVRGELARCGVALAMAADTCTMCTPGYFSFRGRRDAARQALLVWRRP